MTQSDRSHLNQKIGHFLRRWRYARGGNFAIIFALSIIPILVALGAAIDLSRAYVVEERLRSALDAAGLAVGTDPSLTLAQMKTVAQSYFDANYPAGQIGVPGTVSVTSSNQVVTLSVSATMPTTVMSIVGKDSLTISASNEITREGKKLEVALVLDNTGSMSSSNKMTSLKTAAKNLITILQNSGAQPGEIKVAVVPFTVDVKVGSNLKTATWLKWTWTTPKYQTEVCTTTGSGRNKKTTCTYEDYEYNISPTNNAVCVIDRDQNYDASNSLPVAGTAATLYPVDTADCGPVSILPLTTTWSDMTSKIDSMVSSGNTNTTIGLAWGWNMLTPGAPLSTASAPADDLNKAIVFLTDGTNTENRFTNSSSSAIDARTTAICNALRTAGVQVYTIRVIDGNSSLLKACATKADMYYEVTQSSELDAVFKSIALALSNLRVSK